MFGNQSQAQSPQSGSLSLGPPYDDNIMHQFDPSDPYNTQFTDQAVMGPQNQEAFEAGFDEVVDQIYQRMKARASVDQLGMSDSQEGF